MKRSHVQTGGLLAAGLAVALVVHFWPGGDAMEAVPAISDSPTVQISRSATPSASPSAVPSAAPSPGGTASAIASPNPTADASSSLEPSMPESSPEEEPAAPLPVDGLGVRRNNTKTVMVGWDAVPTASRYVVYSNGGEIARVAETTAIFVWETDSLRIGIAAETAAGVGPVSTIRVQRPAGAAPTSNPTSNAPTESAAPEPTQSPTSQPAATESYPVALPDPTFSEFTPPGKPAPPSENPDNDLAAEG